MTLLGFTLGKIYPAITKQIDKVIIVIIVVSLMPGRHQLPHQPPEEDAARRRRSPPDGEGPPTEAEGEGAPQPPKSRAPAPKVAFPKKAQPPTHAEFAARLPAPVGKRFEAVRAFLKKQGAAEDFYYYGPRTGWAYRYLQDEQSLCSIMLSDGRLVGIVALDGAAQAKVAWDALGRRPARAQARPRHARAAVARRPARRHGRDRLQGAAQGQARARRLKNRNPRSDPSLGSRRAVTAPARNRDTTPVPSATRKENHLSRAIPCLPFRYRSTTDSKCVIGVSPYLAISGHLFFGAGLHPNTNVRSKARPNFFGGLRGERSAFSLSSGFAHAYVRAANRPPASSQEAGKHVSAEETRTA